MEEHRPKKLWGQVRDATPLKHCSYRTEQACVGWIKRYIYFHDVRHSSEMGALEVEAFLTHLAVRQNAAAQGQCLSGLRPLPHRATYALRPPDERGAPTRCQVGAQLGT